MLRNQTRDLLDDECGSAVARTLTVSVAATLRLINKKRCDWLQSNPHLDGGLPR